MLYTQTGTPYYASPEVWSDKPYNDKSDIWSLGCVIYEAAALHPPFMASDMKGLYQKVVNGKYPDIPRYYSSDLGELIKLLLVKNPSQRPSCSIMCFYYRPNIETAYDREESKTGASINSCQSSYGGRQNVGHYCITTKS